MDFQTNIIVGLGVVVLVVLAFSLKKASKNAKLAAKLQGELTSTQQDMVKMGQDHVQAVATLEHNHEVAVIGLNEAHAQVVAEHVAVADGLKADIVTMREEHIIALDRAEQEKILAVARVENKITDFRDRQRMLMNEIFGEEKNAEEAPKPVAVLKPAAAGQVVAALEVVEVEAPVAIAAKEIVEEEAPLAAKEAAESAARDLEIAALEPTGGFALDEEPALAAKTGDFAEQELAAFSEPEEDFSAPPVRTSAPVKPTPQSKPAALPWLQRPLEA